LVENLQRADLDPIEAARGYQRLIDEHRYTQEEVAVRVGKERPTIANALRLLKLPPFVLDALRDGHISAGHARALLPIADRGGLKSVVARIVADDLSVRDTEKRVSQMVKAPKAPIAAPRDKRAFSFATRTLMETLHAQIGIRSRKDGGGTIVISFSNAEELDRIVSTIGGPR
jgi:ParB family chromosome partitioning protein